MDKKTSFNQNDHFMVVNKFILTFITIIDLFMFVGYLSDYAKGNISLGFTISVEICVLVTFLANIVSWKKYAAQFKYIAMYGYFVMYMMVLFGAKNDAVFCIVFPITFLFMLYFDYNIIRMIAILFGTVNIIDILYAVIILQHMHSGIPVNTTTLLLQGASSCVYLAGLLGVTKLSNANNQRKIDSIDTEREKSNSLLEAVLNVVETVRFNASKAKDCMDHLGEAVEATSEALENISVGNTTNTENIEHQTNMTGNIQELIQSTKEMSTQMLELSKESAESVSGGREAMSKLHEQSIRAAETNEQVVSSVEGLIENSNAVGAITEQIFSISAQTNLLALNASIESARAGEAGKGFAVVADEIRQLADKTKDLTKQIQEIVSDLQKNADTAKITVDHVLKVSVDEKELISDAENKFSTIGGHMQQLNSTVTDIYEKIDAILISNDAIVDSITHISSVSQEVSASTSDAVTLGNECSKNAKYAVELMNELTESVHQLDKYLD